MLLGERLEGLKWTIGGYRVETRMSEFAWIFQETGSAINALVERFIEKPYFFYTEHDIHAFLYHRLVSGKLGELFVETSSGDKTVLVHREYPTLNAYVGPRGKRTRGHFDLSIIDPAHAAESHWRLRIKKPPYSRHAPKVAIEIGLNAIGTTRLDLKHFGKDFARLADPKNLVERGYLLFFVRREDFAGSGMLPIIAQLPDRLQLRFENRDRTNKLAIIYTESRTPEPGLLRVIPEDRSSWIGS
jgi:hypothetical protein